jgi:hypothetical protein
MEHAGVEREAETAWQTRLTHMFAEGPHGPPPSATASTRGGGLRQRRSDHKAYHKPRAGMRHWIRVGIEFVLL